MVSHEMPTTGGTDREKTEKEIQDELNAELERVMREADEVLVNAARIPEEKLRGAAMNAESAGYGQEEGEEEEAANEETGEKIRYSNRRHRTSAGPGRNAKVRLSVDGKHAQIEVGVKDRSGEWSYRWEDLKDGQSIFNNPDSNFYKKVELRRFAGTWYWNDAEKDFERRGSATEKNGDHADLMQAREAARAYMLRVRFPSQAAHREVARRIDEAANVEALEPIYVEMREYPIRKRGEENWVEAGVGGRVRDDADDADAIRERELADRLAQLRAEVERLGRAPDRAAATRDRSTGDDRDRGRDRGRDRDRVRDDRERGRREDRPRTTEIQLFGRRVRRIIEGDAERYEIWGKREGEDRASWQPLIDEQEYIVERNGSRGRAKWESEFSNFKEFQPNEATVAATTTEPRTPDGDIAPADLMNEIFRGEGAALLEGVRGTAAIYGAELVVATVRGGLKFRGVADAARIETVAQFVSDIAAGRRLSDATVANMRTVVGQHDVFTVLRDIPGIVEHWRREEDDFFVQDMLAIPSLILNSRLMRWTLEIGITRDRVAESLRHLISLPLNDRTIANENAIRIYLQRNLNLRVARLLSHSVYLYIHGTGEGSRTFEMLEAAHFYGMTNAEREAEVLRLRNRNR